MTSLEAILAGTWLAFAQPFCAPTFVELALSDRFAGKLSARIDDGRVNPPDGALFEVRWLSGEKHLLRLKYGPDGACFGEYRIIGDPA